MEATISMVFREQPKAVEDKAVDFLIGCVLRKTKGLGDLETIRESIKKRLN